MTTGSWKTEVDIDTPPADPNCNPGFQLPIASQKWSPADPFLLFLPLKTISVIVENANSYAEQLKKKLKSFKWFSLTVKEFLAFLSLIFFMGMVKLLLDDLQLSCSSYVPGQKLSIDERMVASKGRFCMKQFIKDKPVRWGFKFGVFPWPETGYTYKFEVYTGKRLTKQAMAWDMMLS